MKKLIFKFGVLLLLAGLLLVGSSQLFGEAPAFADLCLVISGGCRDNGCTAGICGRQSPFFEGAFFDDCWCLDGFQ